MCDCVNLFFFYCIITPLCSISFQSATLTTVNTDSERARINHMMVKSRKVDKGQKGLTIHKQLAKAYSYVYGMNFVNKFDKHKL